MALDEINEYPNTATAIVTGSFFDIDMLIGTGTWQSQKVPFGVMQTFIADSSANFSNTDLTFTGNRAHDTNGLNFELTTDAGLYGASWLYVNHSAGVGIGFDSYSFDAGSTSAGITANGSTVINCFSGVAVVNDAGADYDFRVEGDTDANLFFADASTDRVGIGTNTPLYKLHVECLNDDGLLLASTSAGNDVDQSAIYFATSSGATSGIKGHRGNTSTNVGLRFDVSGKADALIINPDGTFIGLPFEQTYAISDEVFDLITGTAKITFRMPHAVTLTDVRASVSTAPTGSTIIVDINQTASTILSTKLTIDATEKTSTTAAVPAVISTSALTDDAEITIDIDQVGSTIAGVGLKVTLIGTRA